MKSNRLHRDLPLAQGSVPRPGSEIERDPGERHKALKLKSLFVVAPSEKKKSKNLVPVASVRKKSRHILLVEDHGPTRKVLVQLLLHRHFKVTSTASIAQARLLMKKYKYFHLLISDIDLPDGSGHDLIDEFRKKFGAKGIALTGYGSEQAVARSRSSGFTAHLTKPVRLESLENALAAALKQSEDKVFIKNGMPR